MYGYDNAFFSTEENQQYLVSWEAVPMREQNIIYPSSQGNSLNRFYNYCGIQTEGKPFVVIPQTFIPTFHICSDVRIGS